MDMDWDVNKVLRNISKSLEVADFGTRYIVVLVPIGDKIGIYFYDALSYKLDYDEWISIETLVASSIKNAGKMKIVKYEQFKWCTGYPLIVEDIERAIRTEEFDPEYLYTEEELYALAREV